MPKYKTIADDLRKKINNHEYEIGQKLPYEYVLCVTYHCNKETMKKALDILVKEGLIIRRRGAGTFVKDVKSNEKDYSMHSLSHKFDGKIVTNEVKEFEVVTSNEEIAKKLHIDKGDFIYHIIRYRSVDHKPLIVEISYIPISVVPNLKLSTLKDSIYQFIKETLNLKIQSSRINITANLSTELERNFLDIKEGEPYIQEEQITYLSNGAVLEYTLRRYDYKSYSFHTNIIN